MSDYVELLGCSITESNIVLLKEKMPRVDTDLLNRHLGEMFVTPYPDCDDYDIVAIFEFVEHYKFGELSQHFPLYHVYPVPATPKEN